MKSYVGCRLHELWKNDDKLQRNNIHYIHNLSRGRSFYMICPTSKSIKVEEKKEARKAAAPTTEDLYAFA